MAITNQMPNCHCQGCHSTNKVEPWECGMVWSSFWVRHSWLLILICQIYRDAWVSALGSPWTLSPGTWFWMATLHFHWRGHGQTTTANPMDSFIRLLAAAADHHHHRPSRSMSVQGDQCSTPFIPTHTHYSSPQPGYSHNGLNRFGPREHIMSVLTIMHTPLKSQVLLHRIKLDASHSCSKRKRKWVCITEYYSR